MSGRATGGTGGVRVNGVVPDVPSRIRIRVTGNGKPRTLRPEEVVSQCKLEGLTLKSHGSDAVLLQNIFASVVRGERPVNAASNAVLGVGDEFDVNGPANVHCQVVR